MITACTLKSQGSLFSSTNRHIDTISTSLKVIFCQRALHTEEISHWHCGHSRQKVSTAQSYREKCYFYFINCFVCFKGQTKKNQHWEFWHGEVQWVIQYELCVPLIKWWNPKYALCVNTDTSREKRWRHPEGEKGQWEHPGIKNWRIPQTDRQEYRKLRQQ